MGRISKALEKLRVKCTEQGAHPNGNSVADILDCIAEHFSAGGGSDMFVVNFGFDENYNPTCDKSYTEITGAHEAGKTMIAFNAEGDVLPTVRIGDDYCLFSQLCVSASSKQDEEEVGTITSLACHSYKITTQNVVSYEYYKKDFE